MLFNADNAGIKTIILGDFNFDLLSMSSCSTRFIDLFSSFNFHQLISVPTRPVSGTLLDHIFVSNKENVLNSGTLPVSLSDHLPVFVTWKTRNNITKSFCHKPISYRSLKTFSAENFLADLNCVPWNTLDMFTDLNDTLDHWYALFNTVLDVHAPFKIKRVKRLHQPEWFSAEISAAIKERDNLHKLALSFHTASSWRDY